MLGEKVSFVCPTIMSAAVDQGSDVDVTKNLIKGMSKEF